MSDLPEKSHMLTNEKWSHIIRVVRAETVPGFQISKKVMEIILREAAPAICKQERERIQNLLAAEAEKLEDVPLEFSAPARRDALSGAWTLRKFLAALEDSDG